MKKAFLLAVSCIAICSLSTKTFASGDNSPGKEQTVKVEQLSQVSDFKIEVIEPTYFAMQDMVVIVSPVAEIVTDFNSPDPSAEPAYSPRLDERSGSPDKLRPDKLNLGYSTAADPPNLYKSDIADRRWKDVHRRMRSEHA